MSKTFNFSQSSVPGQYSINIRDRYMMNFTDGRSEPIFRTVFTAIADVLKIHQNKNKHKVGFILKDTKGVFKIGAIMTYKSPEEGEEDDSGNWYLEFTFDESDMVNLDDIHEAPSAEFTMCANKECYDIASCRFKDTVCMYNIVECVIDTIKEFLDANVEDNGEEVELVLNGVFTASAVVEDGVKIMSIVPGEIIKQIIKEDSVL